MQWSIDSADAYSLARVRHAVVDELGRLAGPRADLFAVETVLGEVLAAEMGRGHQALAITIEEAIGGPCVHIYTQGPPGIAGTQGELSKAILRATRLPMSIERTSQGTHIALHVRLPHEHGLIKQGANSKPA